MDRDLIFDDNISRKREQILSSIVDLRVKCNSDVLVCENQLEELKRICSHDWQYYPDPSGNNDSCYVCNICDKEVKRIPK